ncbi:MAG: hypothetical protein WCW44_05165 [archaeon]|jgi:hypothetical protein
MAKKINYTETKGFVVWIEEGIARVKVKPNAEIDLMDVVCYEKAITCFAKNTPMLVIFDIRELLSISDPALNYLLTNEKTMKPLTIAAAILFSFPTMRIRLILNVLTLLKKPPFPMKVFMDEKKALAWLKSFPQR